MTTFSQTAEIVKASDGRYGLRAPKGGCTVDGKFYRGGSFCPPYKVDNPHELPVVEVKGASYLVQPMTPADGQVSAVRLIKRTTKEGHEVARLADGSVACTCPAFHYGNGSMCKHAVHAVANGLVPVAPVDEVEPVVEAPATAIERFTAGITSFERLCDECIEGEREEGSSAPCEPDAPAVEAEAEDEPARVPDGPVDLDSPWVDHFARLYSDVVLECVERARDKTRRDSPLYPWRALMEGERRSFVRWFDRVGFEVEMDCDWTRFDHFLSLCLEGSPVSFPELGPAPSWDAERFEPTLDESIESFEDDPEYHDWLDRLAAERMEEAFAESGADWHPDERIRAVGYVEARLA